MKKLVVLLVLFVVLAILFLAICGTSSKFAKSDIVTTSDSLWLNAGGLDVIGNSVTCVPSVTQRFTVTDIKNIGPRELVSYWYLLTPVNDPYGLCQSGWGAENSIPK